MAWTFVPLMRRVPVLLFQLKQGLEHCLIPEYEESYVRFTEVSVLRRFEMCFPGRLHPSAFIPKQGSIWMTLKHRWQCHLVVSKKRREFHRALHRKRANHGLSAPNNKRHSLKVTHRFICTQDGVSGTASCGLYDES